VRLPYIVADFERLSARLVFPQLLPTRVGLLLESLSPGIRQIFGLKQAASRVTSARDLQAVHGLPSGDTIRKRRSYCNDLTVLRT
jgi:hypothetical protein